MRRLLLLVFVLVAVPIAAQEVNGTNHLAWDQPGPDLFTVVGYTYAQYPDAATTAVVLTGVTCAGAASPFQCVAPFPSFAPGTHTLTLVARDITGESPKSTGISFQFVVIPLAPLNVRITP